MVTSISGVNWDSAWDARQPGSYVEEPVFFIRGDARRHQRALYLLESWMNQNVQAAGEPRRACSWSNVVNVIARSIQA